MTEAEILGQARSLLSDPGGTRYTPALLGLHLQECLRDFTGRTGVVRKRMPVQYRNEYLILPPDCLEVRRLTDAKGRVLPITSSVRLDRINLSWGEDTGIPVEYLRDLTGVDSLLLHPKPTTEGTLIVWYVHQHVPFDTIELPSRYHAALVWGVVKKSLADSTNPDDQSLIQMAHTMYEDAVSEAQGEASQNFDSTIRHVTPDW